MTVKLSATMTACAIGLAVLAGPMLVRAEQLGTSCADCPSYRGAFSLENTTGVIVRYQVKWGASHAWEGMTLQTGHTKTHSYPLDESARAPIPYVRFDRIGGDQAITEKVYEMGFHKVGYSGYGGRPSTAEPKGYVFRYAADGKHLDIKAK